MTAVKTQTMAIVPANRKIALSSTTLRLKPVRLKTVGVTLTRLKARGELGAIKLLLSEECERLTHTRLSPAAVILTTLARCLLGMCKEDEREMEDSNYYRRHENYFRFV